MDAVSVKKKRGRPKKTPTNIISPSLYDHDTETVATDLVDEINNLNKEVFEFPKESTYTEPEWVYYVKRSEKPDQVVRMLAHKSFAEYSKDNTKTEHNPLTITELEQTLRVDDSYYKLITDAFKEATRLDPKESQDRLMSAIQTRSIEAFKALYAGLKTVTLVVSEDTNKGTVVSFNAVIACQDGTYEFTVNLI